jgi:hypothetical protein
MCVLPCEKFLNVTFITSGRVLQKIAALELADDATSPMRVRDRAARMG